MKRCAVGLLAAVAVAACFDDPTSGLREGPASLRLSVSKAFLAPESTIVVTGTILDAQGNPLPGTLSFSSVDPSIATAADQPGDTLPGRLESSGLIVGVIAGATYVRVTGGGVADSVYVVVVPAQFTGTIAPATANVGDTITLTAPASVTFDPAVTVSVGGAVTFLTSVSSAQVKFLSPNATNGVVSIDGLILINQIALPPLDATTTITVTEPNEPGNSSLSGALTVSPTGTYQTYHGTLTDGSDGNDFFRVVLTSAMKIEAELDFQGDGSGGGGGNPDVDVYVVRDLNGNGQINLDDFCDEFGGNFVLADCTGATAVQPEHEITQTLPAGTYWINVELFANDDVTVPILYRLRYRVVP